MKKENKSTKPTKEKKKLSKAAIVLIVGLLIIVIPVAVFGGILLSAAMQTGTPITGDRFKGDLDPAITDENISAIVTKLESNTKIESVTVDVITAQLRINVDTVDTLTVEEGELLAQEIYESVNAIVPMKTYFTATDGKKMYDLSINVYNFIDSESDSMVYYILTKNSMMEAPSIQLVSEPLDAELAAELRGETIEDTTTTE